MPSFKISAAASIVVLSMVGCSSAPSSQAGSAVGEPVTHEYRTGSILVQKDKHVTTDEERRRAQETIDEIRSLPGAVPSSR